MPPLDSLGEKIITAESLRVMSENIKGKGINMKNELTTSNNNVAIVQSPFSASAMTNEQMQIIKTQIAPGISDNDLMYCLEIAKQAQLNPIIKDIYFVPRKQNLGTYQNPQWVEKHEPMVGRKGARAIARRKGMIVPPTTGYTLKNFPYLENGEWKEKRDLIGWAELEIAGQKVRKEAAYSIYKQTNKDGKVTQFWEKMPTTMVEKVAEFQLLDAIYGLDGVMSIDAGVLGDEDLTQVTSKSQQVAILSDEIETAILQLGFSIKKENGIAIVTGKTFGHDKMFKQLGFTYADGIWSMPYNEVITIPASFEPQPVSNNPLEDLKLAIAELGGNLTPPKANSKGTLWVMAEVEEDAGGAVADRLIELGFKKSGENWVKQVDAN